MAVVLTQIEGVLAQLLERFVRNKEVSILGDDVELALRVVGDQAAEFERKH